ncbi:MAG: hypothetical protein M1818_002514 [Claussenomyces sp. TS43310]|nr:MAG: hypothetical protein M1818_002514 [Claussenomyces sp. TS43310]
MAAKPGEDIAVTLFADVHYYYGPPTAKPPHHRFDKGSYVYLYENASQRRARIEIANNAGTPDQDAFDGFLDQSHIDYSYQHPSMVTLRVDGLGAAPASIDTNQWHLPTFDPHNQTKYLYRLHTIDVYFWTKEDALSFIGTLRRVLSTSQLRIQDESAVSQVHEMSPVVKNLEHLAISDPQYQDRHTREGSTTSFPGPPTAAFPGPPTSAFPGSPTSVSPTQQESANFAPIAYNPAAPAAPETIQHREKTPPPEDGATNPLAMAAATDQGQHFAPGFQQFAGPPSSGSAPMQSSYFPGPPQAGIKSPYGPGSVPPTPKPNSAGSYQQNPYGQHAGFTPQYAQQQAQYANHPGSPGFQSSMQSPPLSPPPVYSQGMSLPASAAPSAPMGGFSGYSYSQAQNPAGANEYAVHQQIYRPTEGEAAVKGHKTPKEPRGKLEDSAVRLEKGVTGFLKKLEKKYA